MSLTLPAFGQVLATDSVSAEEVQRVKATFGAANTATLVESSAGLPVIHQNAVAQTFTQAGAIAINTVLLTIDMNQMGGVTIQCTSMGTSGVVTPEWSNDNATWVGATVFTPAGASATTFNAAGMWSVQRVARYLRLRLSTGASAGTTTIATSAFGQLPQPFFATQPVSGTVSANSTAVASTVRMGFVGAAGIWYDDSSTALGAGASFTGTLRDLTVTATATAFANAATYAKELIVSAESDVTGTLWLEVSRDNGVTWRRVKSVATTAVTGGGFYAEIIHQPSWRYARVGYTNGATAQARFTIGTILQAI